MVKILIIDDEAPVRKMLKKLFEKNDYAVTEATNGRHGVELFKAHHFDLIITDLIMPEKDGLDTIGKIKELDPDVKIIAISGGGRDDPEMYLDFALEFGAVRTFAKPFDNDILLSTIKELLSEK